MENQIKVGDILDKDKVRETLVQTLEANNAGEVSMKMHGKDGYTFEMKVYKTIEEED